MKGGYMLHEQSADFEHEAHPSNLVHLTKDRPKSIKRKLSRKESVPNGNLNTTINSSDQANPLVLSGSSRKKSPPPLSPKPKQKPDNVKVVKNVEKAELPIINKKQSSFKLPGMDELYGKKIQKTNKADDQQSTKKEDSLIQLVTYKKDVLDKSEETIQGTPVMTPNKSPEHERRINAFATKRANSVHVKSSTNNRTRVLTRSYSTGRDVRSLRERLENGGNTIRNGISRFGSSVTARASFRESKKGSKEEAEELISEDPDENTNHIVKIKKEEHEQLEKEKLERDNQVKPPKDKIRLTSTHSVRITPSKRPPIIPTYRRLNSSPVSLRKSDDDVEADILENLNAMQDQIGREKPTETYKKLESSPKMASKKGLDFQTSFDEIVNDFEEFIEQQSFKDISQKKLDLQRLKELSATKSPERTKYTNNVQPLNEVDEYKNKRSENDEGIIREGLMKENIDNSTTFIKPHTSDVDHLIKTSNEDQQSATTINSQETTIFGTTRFDENKREEQSSLSRSYTWSPIKTASKVNSKDRKSSAQNDYLTEDKIQTTPVVRKSYSIKTYTPKPVRRKIDELGRILDRRGSAQRTILNSLPFLGKSKNRSSEEKQVSKKVEQVAELIEEDMASTEYESNFKKSNARKASQDSWLGKSGLFEFDTSSKQKAPLLERGRQHKSQDVEQQGLLEEDSDEDSYLDRSIEKKSEKQQQQNNNNEGFSNKNEKSKKMIKLGGALSFKKNKYNFEKV